MMFQGSHRHAALRNFLVYSRTRPGYRSGYRTRLRFFSSTVKRDLHARANTLLFRINVVPKKGLEPPELIKMLGVNDINHGNT